MSRYFIKQNLLNINYSTGWCFLAVLLPSHPVLPSFSIRRDRFLQLTTAFVGPYNSNFFP